MSRTVEFKSKGISISGNLFSPPADSGKSRKRAGIVVSHPFGGVK
jgi:fermentation-respiration switch protein FrsA (DUF1100 family)